MSGFSIVNETRAGIPAKARFSAIKKAALDTDYDLSLIFTTPASIRKLNLIYRDKDKATEILSFPISKKEGEIYVCQSEARKEAKKFNRPYGNFLYFLFIHGCVHLKGYDHGSRMESIEAKLRKKFGI
jgi:probable rRNA maturation factor